MPRLPAGIRRLVILQTASVLIWCVSTAAGEPAPEYAEHQDLLYYLDAEGRRQPVDSVSDWEIRRRHVLEHAQRVMGPLPRPREPVPLDVNVVETERVGALTRKKLVYHTDSAERTVSAYLLLPEIAPGEKAPAILCLHSTQPRGKGEPVGLSERESRHYALHLAERGYVTLTPDYPSFGEYEYDFAADDYISGTMKAIYDNIRAVDLLQSLPEVDPERIGCIGHSLGGHNAIFTAVFEPRIKAVVSNCVFTRFHKYYGGNLKGWTSARYMPLIAEKYGNNPDRVPFDFTELVAALAPRPFLASAPLHDDNFEVSGVRDVMAAAQPIYAIYGKPDHLQANYPDCAHDFPPEAREVAYGFLDRYLKP